MADVCRVNYRVRIQPDSGREQRLDAFTHIPQNEGEPVVRPAALSAERDRAPADEWHGVE